VNRTNAIILVLAGGVFMSFAGVTLRFIEDANSVQILIYRSFTLACVIPLIACWRRKVGLSAFFASIRREDWIMGALMASAFSFYIYSILNTSVASTLFILAAAPFLAAVVGWLWIGEKPQLSTWLCMVLALCGVGVMVFDGLGSGQIIGNMMALISAASFAIALVYVRRTNSEDMLGGTFLGGILASLANIALALWLGYSILISVNDTSISMVSGALTIGIGMALVIWGASHLPAAEVSILVLIESVVGPLWVWIVFGETVSTLLLTGGAIVLVSVSLQAWFSRPRLQRSRGFRFGPTGVEVHQESDTRRK